MSENTRELLNEYIDWCDKLKEELKEEVKQLKAGYDNLIIHYDSQLKAVIDKHNKLLEEKNQLETKNMKLRVALQKIKNLLKNKSWSCGEENHKECDLKPYCTEFCKLQILNICEEVE